MAWLKEKTVKELIEKVSHILADTVVLYVKTLNFHWNMVGPEFFMYHRLLEEQYKEMADAIDEIAERIRMLGGKAPGSMEEFLKLACMKESKTDLKQDAMIKELVSSNEGLVAHCHEVIAYCDEVKDQGTSDMLIERLRAHDKAAWLLRSHYR